MVIKQELLGKLREFGLNSYESKLWISLLGRGISTAGELSDISNVPRSRAYDVLESLEKKGFIIVKLGKPIKYIAVNPGEVLERVKKKVHEEANLKTKQLENLKKSELLVELGQLHKDGVELIDPTEQSGAFRGREKMYDHIVSMIKGAEKRIVISTTSSGLKRKYSRFKNDLEKANTRGVKIRIATTLDDTVKDVVKNINGYAEVRGTDKESRFCIIDGREMALMLTDDKNVHESFDSGIWVRTPYFVQHFEYMFDKDWKDMKKL